MDPRVRQQLGKSPSKAELHDPGSSLLARSGLADSVMSAFSIGHTLSTAIEWAVVQLHEAHM